MSKHLVYLLVLILIIISGCAVKASNPDFAMIKKRQVNTLDLKSKDYFRSKVITIVDQEGNELIVNHGLFTPEFIEIPPGRYKITYACVPGTYNSRADLISYANQYENSWRVRIEFFDLTSGEMIRTKHSNRAPNGCGLEMITCTGRCL